MKGKFIFGGIAFVFLGTLFLLENFELVNFSWSNVWQYWPLILITVGVNKVLSVSNSKLATPIMVSVTLLSLLFLSYKGLSKRNHDNDFDFNIFHDEIFNDEEEASVTNDSVNYVESYDALYKNVKLNISGGAGKINLNNTTPELFNATVNDTINKFVLKKTESDSLVKIDFSSKNKKKFVFDSEKVSTATIMLNTNPLWDMEISMGAGEIDFDLTPYKIKSAKFKGGAAAFQIKLGDKVADTKLFAETGVASVSIQIPKNSGCQIVSSSGLSSKDFSGFNNKGNGLYETENFNNSKNKIYLTLKGGLSSFEVNRY